ncbi:MAG: urease accessory protein UreE [bacterium]|tara:strand:- start:9287 stop:9727 length:441 start_codon:yes stop_codon:yes gene_type:complete
MNIIETISGQLKDRETREIQKIPLGWEERTKSRQKVRTENGEEFAIALTTGQTLKVGDILLEDRDRVVVIDAIKEDVLVLHPNSAEEMAKIAFQIGNRHAPIQIEKDRILTPYDRLMEDFLKKLHFDCEVSVETFTHDFSTYHHHS